MNANGAPTRLGVIGAGTMGAGIAQLGCLAGIETALHDPIAEALEQGGERVRAGLAKGAERGRWSEDEAEAAAGRLTLAPELDGLSRVELVIEAAPERIELKRELFGALSEVCGEGAVLASNTSSIPITELASSAAAPENVVGMHFFNPAPLMRLVEVIAAEQTGERALAVAGAAGEAMGKRVIRASDGPGFLVNRCGRPFGAEALRLLGEQMATIEQIDRIYRLGGGFRMGPFELMDLVGIDVGFAVAQSFTELSFGEPRWKPHPIQARMVAAGKLGRKAGRGYYDYASEPYRPEDPEPPAPGGGDGHAVAIVGDGALADGLRERAEAAGYQALPDATAGEPELVVDARIGPGEAGAGDATPRIVSCAAASLAARGDRAACGFHLLPPLDSARLVELARLPSTPDGTCTAAEDLFHSLGFVCEWVADAPGLVLGRVVCQLVNEAAFAIGEGVGSAADVDAGLELGLNHPRGPVAWGEAIGLENVLATIDALYAERGEERYRAAPALRSAVATGMAL